MSGDHSGHSVQRQKLSTAIISGFRTRRAIRIGVAAHYVKGTGDDRECLSCFNNKPASVRGRILGMD